jgi:hypothetical protein
MANCGPTQIGASPANIKWNVVRGDTARLLVEFLENDEETPIDVSGWDFSATAYNPSTNVSDELDVESSTGAVEIIAPDSITEQWGSAFGKTVASLNFDLQVTLDNGDIWTPVVGTIHVTGDVTGVI